MDVDGPGRLEAEKGRIMKWWIFVIVVDVVGVLVPIGMAALQYHLDNRGMFWLWMAIIPWNTYLLMCVIRNYKNARRSHEASDDAV